MLYNIKNTSKNLEGNQKRRNFALAFGNEAKRTWKFLNKVKKLNKNLADSNKVHNFVSAFRRKPPKPENIEKITIKCNEVVQEQNNDSVNFDTRQ